MTNPAKDKGDRFERKAVAFLLDVAGDLPLHSKPQRMLGAGRKEDVGDLHVFLDVAIQVRALADLGKAVRSSASDAVVQAANAGVPHHLGMTPIPRVQPGAVAWVMSALDWPAPALPVVEFGTISPAIAWLRTDVAPKGFLAHPREHRIAALVTAGKPTVLLGTPEAWLASYRASLQVSGLIAA